MPISGRVGTWARLAIGVVVLSWLVGCGEAPRSRVVVQVGRTSIDQDEVTHWAGVASRGGSLGAVAAQIRETPRRRALRFLISTRWLLGEAARRGLAVSTRAVERELERQEEATFGGAEEFRRDLAATGMTTADAELQTRRELAASGLARMATSRAAAVPHAELLAYYKAHLARFRVPEERDLDIVERIPSRRAALRLAPRLAAAATTAPVWSFHESLARPAQFDASTEQGALVRAIFSATPGRLNGPMRLTHRYVMLVVRGVRPAALKPFAQARATVRRALVAARRKRLAALLFESYRAGWTARSSCSPGFVVQGCRQYRGARAPEANPFAGE